MPDASERLNAALTDRYHVEREIGEGGMATVYLARDLKHNRNVALKVLKPELAAVVGAERFLAEIETTANLQHPHILPLYDSGQADGFLFYVMPYVQGETLRERLDREKQLPVDEAVRIATAVAGALDYAHRQGVVHRDIKPGNILMQDGQPVVGDFGIALAVGSAGGARLTETGLSVGTPFYMSPEQATGDQVIGAASDIYALGAVLYELLTGEPPYLGNTAQAVLGKIIQGQPVSATAVRRAVPQNVDAAIRRALEKLPADRFTSAAEFAKALGDPSFLHGLETAGATGPRGGLWNPLSMGLAAVAAALAIFALWSGTRPEPPAPVARFSLRVDPNQFPSEWLSLSPDGSAMVMASPRRDGAALLLQRWADEEAIPVPGIEEIAIDPVISPDGTEVAYNVNGTSILQVAPLSGGIVRNVAEDAGCCIRWGGDGYLYYQGAESNVRRVAVGGGTPEDVTTILPEGDGEHAYFIPLSGARGIFESSASGGRIEAIRLDTGERNVLTPGVRPYVTRSGHLVYGTTDGRVLAAPIDLDALELTGPSVPLVEGVHVRTADPAFALSERGDLLYWRGGSSAQEASFAWMSRDGSMTPASRAAGTFQPGSANFGWSLSPDGRQVAYRDVSIEDGGEIWVLDLERGTRSRLTFSPGQDWAPRWSADGRTVLFASDRKGDARRDVWAQAADGTGEPRLVLDPERDPTDFVTTEDGEWVVFRAAAPPSRDILAQRPGADTAATPILASPDFDESSPALSPDGRWLAYWSNETGGGGQVYVRPFPDVDGGRWQISSDFGVAPRWSRSGRELFYWGEGGLHVVEVDSSTGFRVGSERVISPNAPLWGGGSTTNDWYDVSADDQRFLVALRGQDPTAERQPELIFVQNFLEEVKARVPVP